MCRNEVPSGRQPTMTEDSVYPDGLESPDDAGNPDVIRGPDDVRGPDDAGGPDDATLLPLEMGLPAGSGEDEKIKDEYLLKVREVAGPLNVKCRTKLINSDIPFDKHSG
jgi:hypothetical protein